MGCSREGFNLLKHPKLLFRKHSWNKWNRKHMFSDTVGPLICLLRKGHRVRTIEEFSEDYGQTPDFVCGFAEIKDYWLACKCCCTFLSKKDLTQKTKLVEFNYKGV